MKKGVSTPVSAMIIIAAIVALLAFIYFSDQYRRAGQADDYVNDLTTVGFVKPTTPKWSGGENKNDVLTTTVKVAKCRVVLTRNGYEKDVDRTVDDRKIQLWKVARVKGQKGKLPGKPPGRAPSPTTIKDYLAKEGIRC